MADSFGNKKVVSSVQSFLMFSSEFKTVITGLAAATDDIFEKVSNISSMPTEYSPFNPFMHSVPKNGTPTLTVNHKTRKLCYRKDDRAMRPIHGALKIFGTP